MAKKVIVVTDGDRTAYRAIRTAAKALNLTPVGDTEGNPTPLGGEAVIRAIREAPGDVAVAMVDDRGDAGRGAGERDLETILRAEALEVLGVVAVAAHTRGVAGTVPDVSVDAAGDVVRGAVGKEGERSGRVLYGDTVDVLRRFPDVPVVGLGDPGKMGGQDRPQEGAPATTEALRMILQGRVNA